MSTDDRHHRVLIRLENDALELQVSSAKGRETFSIPALGLTRLRENHFSRRPPHPRDVEEAIANIEDQLMPWSHRWPPDAQLRTDDESIRELARWAPTEMTDGTQALTSEAIEAVFNRWVALIEGRPSSQDNLPTTAQFSTVLVLLREWMHHLGFDRIAITPAQLLE